MSWYQDAANPTYRWKYRTPIAVDNTGGGAGAIDVTALMPIDFDEFWSNVNQTDARDVRVCAPDGKTLVTYDLAGFVLATRTLTIEVDNYTAPAAGMIQLWVYWGNTSAADAKTVFAPASAKTGFTWLARPAAPIVVVREERPKDTKPAHKLAKASGTTTYVWFDFRDILWTRKTPTGEQVLLEEIEYVTYEVHKADVAQGSMVDATKTRFADGWVAVLVKAGTSGDDHTIVVTAVTTEGRTLISRAELNVRNVKET